MARLRSLSDLILDARKLSDTQNALPRFPDSEVTIYINKGVSEFYDYVIRNRGTRYYEKPYQLITTGGIDINSPPGQGFPGAINNGFSNTFGTVYPLPQDFYQLTYVSVDLSRSAGAQGDVNVALQEYSMMEREALSSCWAGYQGQPFGFMLHGGTTQQAMTTQATVSTQYAIEFLPRPSSGLIIQIFYIPCAQFLIQPYDTIDSLGGLGEEYVSIWAAIRMRRKDDLDTAELQADLESIKERAAAIIPHRQRVGPSRITNVRDAFPGGSYRSRRRRWI